MARIHDHFAGKCSGQARSAIGMVLAAGSVIMPIMIRRAAQKEESMARLRHIAVVVNDLEKAANFYEQVFELKRHGREDLEIGSAVYMSDGVVNLALLNFKGNAAGNKASGMNEGSTFVGAHHFGFQVDDMAETQKRIEQAGGKFHFDLGDERKGNFERKFRDPQGVMFDISHHGWVGTDGSKRK
jgi:predicted enzyme related to lactoylglutathione lyase